MAHQLVARLKRYSSLVVLPHSVFALPFAFASLVLAYRVTPPLRPLPEISGVLIGVLVAVVSARTAAMAFNRLVDARFDRENPRTRLREVPSGSVSEKEVGRLILFSSLVFFFAAWYLGPHCLVLSPVVLVMLLFYSYTKRFTKYAHLVLGVCLALAPGGAWWVIRPAFETTPLLLMGSVLLWVSGFDILYSCQDCEFDKEQGLYSIPSRHGIERSLWVARTFHLFAFIGFFLVGLSANLGAMYRIGVVCLGAILAGQHFYITEKDLSRIDRAFFTFNGMVSIFYLLLVLGTT